MNINFIKKFSFSIKGVLLGCLVTFVLDILGGYLLISLLAKDMSEESFKAASPEILMLPYSLFFRVTTILGGFIAAKYGKLAPYKTAAFVGAQMWMFLCTGDNTLRVFVITFLLTVPAALLGAFLFLRKNEQRI